MIDKCLYFHPGRQDILKPIIYVGNAVYQIEKNNQKGKGLSVLQNNKITPQTIQVLNIIVRENLILATGHLSPKEILLLVTEAKAQYHKLRHCLT